MGHLDNMNADLPSYGDLKAEIKRLQEQLSHGMPAIEELTNEREMYRMRWLGSMTKEEAALIRAENERLRAALKECAADFATEPGTVMSAQVEINREFQRRMDIAGKALNHEQKADKSNG